jgi:hypothetical protein
VEETSISIPHLHIKLRVFLQLTWMEEALAVEETLHWSYHLSKENKT